MKIFIATSDKYYQERLQSALGKEYDITFMSTEQELLSIIHHSFNSEFVEHVDVGYPIVMLDYDMYKRINLAHIFNNNEFFVSYFVLLNDSLDDVDMNLILNTNTALMIPVRKFTDKEISFQLKLLTCNFSHVRKIQNHAWLDSLTQINNRHSFMKNLDSFFDNFVQNKVKFCLAMIDLDHFKEVNDLYGHIKGDMVLSMLTGVMKQNCRDTDILGRVGGEEFAIIFPNTSLKNAYDVVERIRKSVEQTKDTEDILDVTLSAGIVSSSSMHKSGIEMLENADLLMYKAKDLGRNKVCI